MTDKAPSVVEARGVGLTFPGPVEALSDINLTLSEGEFVSLAGPSGCGKSTLLRLVAGLLRPSAGSLTVGGDDPGRARRTRTDMGFVFQQPSLLPWRTVRANVRLPLELRGKLDAAAEARVDELINLVGLREFSTKHPHQLSGGMQMRVSIARALAIRPRVLLMDEPFGALDEITRQRLNEELIEIWRREQCTVLFVTHNVFEAAFLSQRVLVMSKRPGCIAAELRVPFDYPRVRELRHDAAFGRFAGEVSLALENATA